MSHLSCIIVHAILMCLSFLFCSLPWVPVFFFSTLTINFAACIFFGGGLLVFLLFLQQLKHISFHICDLCLAFPLYPPHPSHIYFHFLPNSLISLHACHIQLRFGAWSRFKKKKKGLFFSWLKRELLSIWSNGLSQNTAYLDRIPSLFFRKAA